ncbi:MAG: hypothetical protein V2B15_03190 [Bacteroidota bacterium]
MKSRPSQPILLILLFCALLQLRAQDNQEPSHACFRLNQDRVIPVAWMKCTTDSTIYMSDFLTGETWEGKQVFVRIPGTGTSYTLKINEFPFGSDPGSGQACEYNITPFLREQGNRIALEPVPGQTWAGTFSCPLCGEAVLVIRDGIHIRDLAISSHMEQGDRHALTRIHLFVKSYLPGKNNIPQLNLKVTDPAGKSIFSGSLEQNALLSFGQETELNLDITIEEPMLWSPGHPQLYQMELAQLTRGSRGRETIYTHFGIRNAVVADTLMVFNGDSLCLNLAGDDLLASLIKLPEEEIRNLIRKNAFNAIQYNGPLPCSLLTLFDQEGAVFLIPEKPQHPASIHSHVNSPSVVRAK